MHAINLQDKLTKVHDYWHPHSLGRFNGQDVLVSRMKGDFVYHHHDDTDELFLVVHGEFRMHFTDRTELVKAGECIIIPRGVEHKPVASGEAHVLLIHTAEARNTGNIVSELTRESAPAI
jgi:mannose-6-phosphate isomerase-like protein (cupin superfamily)